MNGRILVDTNILVYATIVPSQKSSEQALSYFGAVDDGKNWSD